MKITLSQLNVMVGDILSNKSKNIDYCHIRFSNIRSRTCYKNPLAHLLSKSPSLNQRNHPFSYDGSHNTEHDIARNCQNKAI